MPNPADTPLDLSLLTAEEREMWERFKARQSRTIEFVVGARTDIPTLLRTLAETRKVLREVKMCADCWPKNQQLQDLIKLLPKEEVKL